MTLTKEQIDAIIPDLKAPITEDEYLACLELDNEGFDYGAIMNYDPEEALRLKKLLEQMVSA